MKKSDIIFVGVSGTISLLIVLTGFTAQYILPKEVYTTSFFNKPLVVVLVWQVFLTIIVIIITLIIRRLKE
jgi:hypothetical protein